MARYFKVSKKSFSYDEIKQYNLTTEKERGLAGLCKSGGKHDWLILPKEEGQKSYLMCLKCHEYSHL